MPNKILSASLLYPSRAGATRLCAPSSLEARNFPREKVDRFDGFSTPGWRTFLPRLSRFSGTGILPENNLPALYERLGVLAGRPDVCVESLGNVKAMPIHLLRMPATGAGTKKNILICAGVHGNEPSGVSAVFELISEIQAKPHLRENFNFYILPCVNPYGFKTVSRRNENDVDLNRAFAASGQENEPEIDVVKPFFEKTSFDLVLDLHSALPKRDGYFVLHRSTLQLLGPAMENFGKAWPVLSNGSKPYQEEAPGICTSAPKGTLKDYLADQGCPHVITLEAPRALAFNERTKGLSRLAGSIIDEFAAQNKAIDSH
ncbi:MAG: DUF2817 domain-containing protein [Myxococcota bacterium]|jgi:predicted deacylase|nr:DUF2817 domain-containing protein [Myxococcota bacterium]